MKCFKHTTEAMAVCAYCGRALCSDCIISPLAPRMVCSPECNSALARDDRAMQMILEKSVQTLKASAFYCYLCGSLSVAAAIVAWYMLPLPFLILFAAGSGAVLIASGLWYTRIARKQTLEPLG
jgi:hypothetical protein